MSDLFKKALTLLTGEASIQGSLKMPKIRPLKKMTERELLRLESEIGSKLFGEIPPGHVREFFCLDDKTWIWHEEWIDAAKVRQRSTTRYEVQGMKILKVQEGARYSFIDGQELENLTMATRLYYEQVARGVYGRDPQTGQKIS